MKTKEILMALSISVMVALFVGLFFDWVYAAPEYEDYCPERERFAKPLPTVPGEKEGCDDVNFVYKDEIDKCYSEDGTPEFDYSEEGCMFYESCNLCSKEYDNANEVYNRNLFFIISPLALIAIIFGLLYGFEVVGSGFMFAGILLLIYSTVRYFGDMSKLMRVIVIFIELVLLLFIANKKMRKK